MKDQDSRRVSSNPWLSTHHLPYSRCSSIRITRTSLTSKTKSDWSLWTSLDPPMVLCHLKSPWWTRPVWATWVPTKLLSLSKAVRLRWTSLLGHLLLNPEWELLSMMQTLKTISVSWKWTKPLRSRMRIMIWPKHCATRSIDWSRSASNCKHLTLRNNWPFNQKTSMSPSV